MLTKRTNILFDPHTWALLTYLSRQKKATIGELVRSAVKKSYDTPKTIKPQDKQLHPLIELRNLAKKLSMPSLSYKEIKAYINEGRRI